MSEALGNKIHELDILLDEFSSLRPNTVVYAKRVPSSNILFMENKEVLKATKSRELAEAKDKLAGVQDL
ncbi:hypothetical protein BG006_000523 [Podila minutissima]|uniref:Uncharacterized protein n=1 Tax=Podila minutissima TaxID=64525 RepID=A0A9P5SB88_9FUNG|nr:hypothetical protein BG006_000523 [Podila minutissima]